MSNYLDQLRQRNVSTPQSQPMTGREAEQSANNAGGFGFATDKWQQLRRFLILGSQGGSYYVGERDLTKANFSAVEACFKEDAEKAINEAWIVYEDNLAPKPDQAIFVLALAAAKLRGEDRKTALEQVPKLRIATHLFMWKGFYEAFGGYSRSVRSAIAEWYNSREADDLAYQMCKYQSRNGHAHWDCLNVAHPTPRTVEHAALFQWAVKKTIAETCPELVSVMESFKGSHPQLDAIAIDAIAKHGLTREMLPTESLNSPDVWQALLAKMPLHALVRNLGVMSNKGLFKPFGDLDSVIAKITDANYIRKSHMHPVALFIAAMTYGQGHGMQGKGQWDVQPQLLAALDHATTAAFDNVEPSGKNIVVAIDGSGSMESGISGYDYISCRHAAVMMALAAVRSELKTYVVGFSDYAWPVPIGKQDSFRSAMQVFNDKIVPTSTDCAAPINLAIREQLLDVDAFVLYTDNESWAGSNHVAEAIRDYNRKTGRNAKIISVAMAANETTVVDPTDPLQLNVVGFDASTPQVISAFIRGDV